MKYLVIGADGQLGQEWVKVLSDQSQDFSFYAYSDLDITDFVKLREIVARENPDVLINCAAYTAVDKAEEETELANLINHEAVQVLAELCEKHQIKLVHYSTDYVFAGSQEDQSRYPEGYDESAIPNPVNEYGKTKWKGEQAIISSGCDSLILRLSWLCGAFGNNFVKTMLRLAELKDSLNVVNDQVGVPTFANQVVLDTVGLLNASCDGTYHLGSKGIITWYDFAKKIFQLSNKEIEVKPVNSSEFPTTAKRPNFSKLDTRKIERDLSITLLPWEEGLGNLLKQIKNED